MMASGITDIFINEKRTEKHLLVGVFLYKLSLMNSNMVKPEKFDLLHLIYHLTVLLNTNVKHLDVLLNQLHF